MKKYNFALCLIALIFLVGCTNEPTSLELATKIEQKYSKHQSISYDIGYQIKFFSNTTDTNKVSAHIDLIRQKEDSVFGGYVWIEADSITRYYDGNFSYYIEHNQKKITRYPKDKPFIITGNIIGEAIRVYFLKPNRLASGVEDSTITKELKLEKIQSQDFWKWTYLFADNGEYSNQYKNIWINKNDLAISKMNYSSTFQNDVQYNQWDLQNIKYDDITPINLKKRLNSLLKTYELEDFKELTAEERAPLKKDTDFPNLNGILYPSNDSTSLNKLRGKVTLVDFWYMNCAPCIDAIPHLNDLNTKYAEDGLVTIGINPFDNTTKSLARFPNFLENNKIDYPILFSERSEMQKFKVRGYPTFYLINNHGKVIYSHVGFGEEMPNAVDSLIQLNLGL